MLKAATDLGVERFEPHVLKLIIDQKRACVGVQRVNNTQIMAKHVLLRTGAYNPTNLAETFSHAPEKRMGDCMVAAGAVSCSVALSDIELSRIQDCPVFIKTMNQTHGKLEGDLPGTTSLMLICLSGIIPPNEDNKTKFNYELSFIDQTLHAPSGQKLSIRPPEQSKSTRSQDVPQQFKDEVSQVVRHTYGDLRTGEHEYGCRMCWSVGILYNEEFLVSHAIYRDAATPTLNFLISPHPKVEGLYVAASGSFLGWKFFPCIGKYTLKMLEGTLDEGHAR